MVEPLLVMGSLAAGAAATVAVMALVAGPGAAWQPPQAVWTEPGRPGSAPGWVRRTELRMGLEIARAGLADSPRQVALVAVALTAGIAGLAAAGGALIDPGTAAGLGLVGAVLSPPCLWLMLRRAADHRRSELLAELGPLLELLSLELSSGSGARPALESVVGRLDGELAAELRRLLGPGPGPALDSRLAELGDRLRLPALLSLAGIIATSREYGSSLSPGVRALASELRRARRREVIAESRRALNRVLVPAAVGVLAPFMAILLFPALTTLAGSLR